MLRRRFHKPGTAPATLVAPPSSEGRKQSITLIEYDAAELTEKEITDPEELRSCRDNGKVSWIDVNGLGDIETLRRLGQIFGLHPLALEDVLNTGQRPKVEHYEDHYFIVLQTVALPQECEVEFEQMSLFLGPTFLITIQEQIGDTFDPVRERLRQGRGFSRSRGHDYLAYALIDSIVDHFFPVLEQIGEAVEELEDELVERPHEATVSHVHDLKRILMHLRRAAWPEREVLSVLARDDSSLIKPETRVFLRDCYDHAVQIMDVLESYREMSAGMIDLYLSSLSNRTNEVMRMLTVVASIFIPLTFIVGLYGMNFDPSVSGWNMPELRMPYGYPACLAVMLLITVALVIYFRKRRWL